MTQQQLIELIQDDFPDKGDVHVRVLLNEALAEFATETRLFKTEAPVTATSGQLHADVPDRFVYAERLFDTNGHEVDRMSSRSYTRHPVGTVGWWVETAPTQLVIGYHHDGADGASFRPLTQSRAFTLRYVETPAPLTTATWTDELPVPAAFQRGLKARVLEQLYAGDPQQRTYWHAVWRDQVRKATRQANRRGHAFYDHLPMHEV